MHYLPLVVYPHTNQPQPTQPITNHQQPHHTLTITYPIILFHYIITIHDNSYCTRHTFAPIVLYTYIYNIIYLSTILYPISYLTSYTRAIISKRQPTARPDTLYRYIYYLSTHIKTSTRHQIRNGNSWR